MKSAMWSPSQFRIDVESNGATLVIAAFDHVRANTYFAKTFIESGSWFARIGVLSTPWRNLVEHTKHIDIFPFLHYRNSLKTLQLTTLTCRIFFGYDRRFCFVKKRFQGNSETWQVQVGQLTTWQDVAAEGRPMLMY